MQMFYRFQWHGRLAVRIVTSDIDDAGSLRFLGFKILDVVDACGDGGECVEGDAGDCCCKVSKDDDLDAGVRIGVAPRVLPADGCMRFRVFDVIGPDVGGKLSPSEMTGDLRIVVALLALVPDKALGDVVSKCDWPKSDDDTDGDRRFDPLECYLSW